MQQKSKILLAVMASVIFWEWGANAHWAVAAEPELPTHMSLVRQLGATSFAQRQSAARKLLAIGVTAKPALVQGMHQEDLEIRLGAHRILVQVLQSDFDGRIAAFLDARGGDGAHDLPGWHLFRDQVGDTPITRHLYADMLRTEQDLIEALARKDVALERMLIDRAQFLTSSNMVFNGRRISVTGPTLATVLLIGTQTLKTPAAESAKRSPSTVTSRIAALLNSSTTRSTIQQGAYSPLIRKLLAGWIDEIGDSQQQYGWSYAMQLVLKYDLREQGPRIAKKVLDNPGNSSSAVPYAAILLGRFGTVKDAARLESHLANTQVFHTWSNTQLKKEPIRIQVRDVVLAMLIRLHGEDPSAYGFKLLQADEQMIYKVYTMGFLKDSQREAAFAKWKARPQRGNEAQRAKGGNANAAKPKAAQVPKLAEPPVAGNDADGK